MDIILLVFTLTAAALSFIYGEMLDFLPYILRVGLYFAGAGLIITLITHICVYKISPIKNHIPLPSAFLKSLAIFSCITMAVAFGLGCLFQYLYSLFIVNATRVDNYIVAVDNSGSMNDSDRIFKRYDALKEMFSMLSKEQRVEVYVFSDNPTLVFPSKQITAQDISDFDRVFAPYKISNGGTETMKLLNQIADNLKTVKNSNTSVIIISDGECSTDYNTLNRFKEAGVPVHTVGVYHNRAGSALYEIAQATGGGYYNIDNMDGLITVLRGITGTKLDQLLIGPRSGQTADSMVYSLMRVLFIFLLSMIIKISQLLTIDIGSVRKRLLVQCIGFSFMAAGLIEILLQRTAMPETLARAVMLLLISVLLIPVLQTKYSSDSVMVGYQGVSHSDGDRKALR